MVIRRTSVTLVLVAALVLVGCGKDAAPGDDGVGPTPAAAADLTFTVATVDGGTFSGDRLRGKPAVLWFWAPWCSTCVSEAPTVKNLAGEYADRVAVVGVAGLGEPQAMREFVTMTGIDGFPQLADTEGLLWKRWEVTAQATFVVLDSEGAVAARGHLEPDELKRRVDGLVG
ncbi:Thiol-disulfide isomerase or thioredoxin [Micromonospora nigra]|uniref:Thiol-disulfide isomerase or thioredoxin n=1 Tax=Micromonospora nigra TaxID=145857 RepID=A0A1C6RAZ4_9ACTN|nr:redoxin domain-containing protein [Micromonospora nigra]SCL14328.1 Thiol-disulfide isomerase or thioredoxin [Micromonospora nigra]